MLGCWCVSFSVIGECLWLVLVIIICIILVLWVCVSMVLWLWLKELWVRLVLILIRCMGLLWDGKFCYCSGLFGVFMFVLGCGVFCGWEG